MSVHKRKLASGRTVFETRWREGNRNRSRAFDDAKTARDYDREVRRLRQAGEFAQELERRRVTVNDLAAEWWSRRAPGLTAKTIENYATQLDLRVLPTFGHRRASQITIADVEKWIAGLRKAKTGDPTIIKSATVLQALLAMAVKDGTLNVNVAQQAAKPAQGRSRTPYLIKPQTVERIRLLMAEQGRERDIVLLELLAYAGLRPESEAIRLQWRQVRDRTLLIRDTKRGRERTVTMPDPLVETLAAWRLRRGRPGPDALVVPSRADTAWSDDEWRYWRRWVFKPSAVRAGLPADARPRDLRGSFASLLLHAGQDIVHVADQLGHSPAICLRDYAQLFSEVDPLNRQPAADQIRAARSFAERTHTVTTTNMFAPSSHAPAAIESLGAKSA